MGAPAARPQGGDVEGQTATDSTWAAPLKVRSASFDPGYDLGTTLAQGDVTPADVVRGYATYGKSIGGSNKRG